MKHNWSTVPQWKDFRLKEKGTIEYIRALEKWMIQHRSELREKQRIYEKQQSGIYLRSGHREIKEILG